MKFFKENIILIAFIIAIFGIISPIVFLIFVKIESLSSAGAWIGGVAAPILSFAGFFMIYAAFTVQKEELEAQKAELKLTRQEFIQQNETLAMQRFENTFFSLINLHNEIIGPMVYEGFASAGAGLGRACFEKYYLDLEQMYRKNKIRETEQNYDDTNYVIFQETYEKYFEKVQDTLGHYFRNLYHIYKFIDNSDDITESSKHRYAGIIRAQLSTYELIMIMYNANSKYGFEKFYPLIKKYNAIKNMNIKFLMDTNHIIIYNDLTSRMLEKM